MTTEAPIATEPEAPPAPASVPTPEPPPAPAAPVAEPEPVSANVGTDEDEPLDLVDIAPSTKPVRIPTDANPKGEIFTLRLLDDFGLLDQQDLLRMSRRFEALWNKEEMLTSDEQISLRRVLDRMFDMVLDAPEEVKRRTPDKVKTRVVTAFTLVPLLERQRREAAQRAAEQAAEGQEPEPESQSADQPTSVS